MLNAREIINQFKAEINLVGKERAVLLSKVVSASIAYTTPVLTGDPADIDDFYLKLVSEKTNDIVSDINEHILIDTNVCVTESRKLWNARYTTLNSVFPDNFPIEFSESIQHKTQYNYWVRRFINAFTK